MPSPTSQPNTPALPDWAIAAIRSIDGQGNTPLTAEQQATVDRLAEQKRNPTVRAYAIPDTRTLAQKAAAADYDAEKMDCAGERGTARRYRELAREYRRAAGIKERDPFTEPRDWSVSPW